MTATTMNQALITGEPCFDNGKPNKEASLADLLLMIFNHGEVKLGDLAASIKQHALDDLMIAECALEHDEGLASDIARTIDRARHWLIFADEIASRISESDAYIAEQERMRRSFEAGRVES